LGYGVAEAIVLFIVEKVNQNQIDQRHVEYRLDEISGQQVRCMRVTLTESAKRLNVDESSHHLYLDDTHRVGVVYFRAGYSPDNYPTEKEWTARRIMELSDAIKCPFIGLQLANTKKVQQVLSEEGVVEKFIEDAALCIKIRRTFACMWGLGNDDRRTENAVDVSWNILSYCYITSYLEVEENPVTLNEFFINNRGQSSCSLIC
ncbi:unnamed protein product, partial [Gongylonema pulchrum]|uniref:Glutathione synthetase n=1 Tax=Gongylonema pulchrum TaxID=637853 RepID=A0A183DBA3_9BILA